ncbi:hypothetical protein TSUD_185960 [Trifolium subterraneum]|uniref:Uncharacterized protein n=1 Tax=Trifolium subterraneum TaxID=3900 RepID=A0A2Z6NTK6_TRISU|nr:hypothetical protein TSUD_185960 [Trifolium subterraneum]
MIHVATSGYKKIALPYAMLLSRVFRLYYADMTNTTSEDHYYTFSLKNVHHMKKDIETPAVDVGSKRKRDDFEKTNLNVLADVSGDQLENDLQTGEQTQISDDVNSTTESDKLVTTAATTLQGFKPVSAPQNTTMFSPLMTSSQGSLSSFCTSEFIRNILTSDTPEISTIPIPKLTDSTLPSIPSSFATFDSFCSSVNTTNAGTQQLVFEGNVNFDFPGPSRPSKRFRLETDMEQMRKDLDTVIKGMSVQHSMMNHLILESKTLRDWFTTVVCPQLHIPPPPEIETPLFDPFPIKEERHRPPPFMANTNNAGAEALHRLKEVDPPSLLVPNPTLSETARAASKYLFSSLRPFSQKCPLDQLLVDGYDAEQIWHQIDLQSQPLLSTLRRRVNQFVKNPDEIAQLVPSGVAKKVEAKKQDEWEEESDDFDEELNDDDDDDDDEDEDDFEGLEKKEKKGGSEGEEDSEEEEVSEEEDEEGEKEKEKGKGGGIEDNFLKINELNEYLEKEENNYEKAEEEDNGDEDSEEDDELEEAGDFEIDEDEDEDDDEDDEEEEEGMENSSNVLCNGDTGVAN